MTVFLGEIPAVAEDHTENVVPRPDQPRHIKFDRTDPLVIHADHRVQFPRPHLFAIQI